MSDKKSELEQHLEQILWDPSERNAALGAGKWLSSRILEKAREKQTPGYSDDGKGGLFQESIITVSNLESIIKELTE